MVSVATEATSFSFIPIAGMATATPVGTRVSLTPKPFIARTAAIAPSGVIVCPVLPRYPPVNAAAWGCLCVDAQKIENIILNFVQILTRKDLPLYTIRTEAPIDIDEAIDKEYGMPSLHQRSQGYTHV